MSSLMMFHLIRYLMCIINVFYCVLCCVLCCVFCCVLLLCSLLCPLLCLLLPSVVVSFVSISKALICDCMCNKQGFNTGDGVILTGIHGV
jgi:hypothetical protein